MKKHLTRIRTSALLSPFGQERRGSSIWTLFEHFSIPALQFVVAIPLVYGLGLPAFGIWTYLLAVASLLGSLTPGIAMAATQLVSGQKDPALRAAAVHLLVLGGLAATTLFTTLGGGAFYYILVAQPPTALKSLPRELVPATVVAVIVNGIMIQWDLICAAALRARLKYKTSSLIDTAGRGVAVIALGLLAILQVDMIPLLYVNALLVLSRVAVKAFAVMRDEAVPEPATVRKVLGPATSYALYQWIQNFSALSYAFADRITVGIFVSPSTVAVAALASQVAHQVHSVPRAFLSPLTPALITYYKNGEAGRFEAALREARRRLRLIILAIAAPVALAGPVVIYIALNLQVPFLQILPVFFAYLVGFAAMSLSIVPYYGLIGQGRLGLSGFINACAALLNIAAALSLGYLFGATGVALSKAAYAVPYMLLPQGGRRRHH